MSHVKKKSSRFDEAPRKGPRLGWVIALSAMGGAVLGSAVTYSFSKTPPAPERTVTSPAGGMPQAQTFTMPPQQSPRLFTPAPQPPGEPPPGKVWSAEHGHWHDAPAAQIIPSSTTVTPPPVAAPPK